MYTLYILTGDNRLENTFHFRSFQKAKAAAVYAVSLGYKVNVFGKSGKLLMGERVP